MSAGFLYTKTGADPDSHNYLNPALDSITIACGAIVQINQKLNAELGILKPFYFGDDGSSAFPPTVTVKLDTSLWVVALGVRYKIFWPNTAPVNDCHPPVP